MNYKNAYIIILCMTFLALAACKKPESTYIPEGITRLENFSSKFISSRNVDVYLPKAYHANPEESFPVIYMHDGQMLFDTALCWNGKSWLAHEILEKSVQNGFAKSAIIVGIWSTDKRWEEYMPEDVFEYLDDKDYLNEYNGVISNRYLKFIVNELKPEIDQRFRTKSDRENTIILGSSMGALISWYALMKYPKIFGKAGCMSTHWPGTEPVYKHPLPVAIKAYFADHLPEPGTHKLYFDHGSETLDKYYQPHQYVIDNILIDKGYRTPKHFLSRHFPGEAHDEIAWNKRLQFPIEFFLPIDKVTK